MYLRNIKKNTRLFTWAIVVTLTPLSISAHANTLQSTYIDFRGAPIQRSYQFPNFNSYSNYSKNTDGKLAKLFNNLLSAKTLLTYGLAIDGAVDTDDLFESVSETTKNLASKTALQFSRYLVNETLNLLYASDHPKWMKAFKFDYGFTKQSGELRYSIDSTIAFYESTRGTLFLKAGMHRNDIQFKTYDNVSSPKDKINNHIENANNFGVGYRYLTMDQTWLLGVNTSYSQQNQNGFERVGLGLEAKSSMIDIYSNFHRGLTEWASSPWDKNYKVRDLDGYDLKITGRIPFIPELQVSAKGYVINRSNGDRKGHELAITYSPTPALYIKFSQDSSHEFEDITEASIGVQFNFDQPISSQLKNIPHTFTKVGNRRYE